MDSHLPMKPPIEPLDSTDSQSHSTSGLDHKAVVSSAVIFALGTLLSRILGLIRDMMTARYFSNDVRDAFINAFRLPNLFRRLFGEGALSISFIPIFVEILAGRDGLSKSDADRRAHELAAGVFSLLTTFVIVISCLAIIFMDDVMRVLLSGEAYLAVPGKFELTVKLGRIMFGFLILISLYAFFMAILNSLRKFAWPAIAPCFFNLAMIAAAFFSQRAGPQPEVALAWSVIVGGFLQMAVLIPPVVRSGFFPRISFKWNSPDTLRVMKAFAPSLLGASVMQLTIIVNMFFASRLPSGSQSYIYLADRILELPLSLFVVSISSALLPTLSHYWANGDKEGMGEAVNHYIRLILFVSFPAALGMLVLAHPIVEVLFLGREFKYNDAVATAQVIQIYSFSVIWAAGARILSQGFYAIQNTWFPALASAVALLCHILFAWVFTRQFGLNGLAAASVLSVAVNFGLLATAYNAWVGKLKFKPLAISVVRFLVCGAVMVGVLQFYGVAVRIVGGRFFSKSLVLIGMILLAGLVYLACAHLLRVPEYKETVASLREKYKRRFAR